MFSRLPSLCFLLFLCVSLCGACSSDPGSGTNSCNPADCEGLCSPFNGDCVQCLTSTQCDTGLHCEAGNCIEDTLCGNPEDCPGGRCNLNSGQCTECLVDHHCGGGGFCIDGTCVGPTQLCGTGTNCPSGLVCNIAYGICLPCHNDDNCLIGEYCGGGGLCMPLQCLEGDSTCKGSQVAYCGPNHNFLPPEDCPLGQTCYMGDCSDLSCTPNSVSCESLQKKTCNPEGTGAQIQPCPPGQYCPDGGKACEPVRHRVMLVYDTSGSMGRFPGTNVILEDCAQEGLPCPMAWPVCEQATTPLTMLSYSKLAFSSALHDATVQERIDFALMRFPQSVRAYRTCRKGHYKGQDTIKNDTNVHTAPSSEAGWFQSNLHQTLCVPFPTNTDGLSNLSELQVWLDFNESVAPTGLNCVGDNDCPSGYCGFPNGDDGEKVCMVHANPEIRASGYTPIGKTLFYAGEYFRQDVFIDGTPCTVHSDCAVAGYRCSDFGQCEDTARHCRQNVILLFSDGVESIQTDPTNFFHPWVQAKRFGYGLGCSDDFDCLGGASCISGRCHVPDIEGSGKICSHTGEACNEDSDCNMNGVFCTDPQLNYIDDQGADILADKHGRPIKLQVHAIDIDNDEDGNKWIATLGRGKHYTVSTQDSENFLKTLILATDLKQGGVCLPE